MFLHTSGGLQNELLPNLHLFFYIFIYSPWSKFKKCPFEEVPLEINISVTEMSTVMVEVYCQNYTVMITDHILGKKNNQEFEGYVVQI